MTFRRPISLARERNALTELVRPYLRRVYLGFFPGRTAHYFRDCWQYPSYALHSGLPERAAAAVAAGCEPDLLFFPMNDWHVRMQRSQQLASAFARLGHRSLYFNPHLGFEYGGPYLGSPASRISILGPRLLEFHTRLPREHIFHRRMPEPSENRRIAAAARELAAVLEMRRAIQVVSFPIWLDTALALRDALGFPIVYDCHDLLSGFGNIAPEIVAAEARLLEVCDRVAFSSAPLFEIKVAEAPAARAKALLLRNAVDADHFCIPHGSGNADRKTVVYVGAIERWFDVEAVRAAAEAHPDCAFVLVGRVDEPRANELLACPNVTLAGEMAYAKLPALLARCDAAMIPFLSNQLTVATNPIKLYEYFSQGLPVVGTRLPEIELHGDLVYVADDAREFAAQVGRAIAECDPERRARRIAVAQRESWTARAGQLLEAMA